ncbi:N-acylglucosamine 2-epimerase-like isoform X2 [Haliotis asinina]
MSIKEKLPSFLEDIEKDLDRTLKFWLENSHDDEFGGFFICLGPDGRVFDETKYTWLECRQVWMYARLYNDLEKYRKPQILQAAIKGADFLKQHMKNPDTMKCCLSMTRDGQPIKIQRTIFSECFYLMAMSELARATGETMYREEALAMMDKILFWVQKDDSQLGKTQLPGNKPYCSLANPMMLLCLIEQMETMDPTLADTYKDSATWCLKEVNKHIQRGGSIILENVSVDGEELAGSNGRLMVPGHAIEAGWFLLQRALKSGDTTLQKTAIDKFIVRPFQTGWDELYGGLFYFLDVDGLSPTQLEWDMKLWWPHNEAMIAFLMAYKATRDEEHLHKFQRVFKYSYSHFVDHCYGDWFGYLNRRGEVKLNFKGGPWKGFFHVPRCQLMCMQLLKDIIASEK